MPQSLIPLNMSLEILKLNSFFICSIYNFICDLQPLLNHQNFIYFVDSLISSFLIFLKFVSILCDIF